MVSRRRGSLVHSRARVRPASAAGPALVMAWARPRGEVAVAGFPEGPRAEVFLAELRDDLRGFEQVEQVLHEHGFLHDGNGDEGGEAGGCEQREVEVRRGAVRGVAVAREVEAAHGGQGASHAESRAIRFMAINWF